MRPLAGVKVLDLSRLLPGPFLTMILADLGAEVVKVEDPRLGDYLRVIPPLQGGLSGRFLAVNRDKRSLALDLKTAAGRDALLRMVDRADVVVESFRPGVMDKLGIGYATLAARRPALVMVSISGYGQDGPYRDRAGHDINYIALAGVLGMGGARGGAPVLPGVQVADLAGGALWGAVGLLAALVGRAATGKGRHVDISMTEGAMALLATELGNQALGAHTTRGAGNLNGGSAGYGVYACADGKWLSVGALEPKFYLAFNAAIGRTADLNEIIAGLDEQDRVRGEIGASLLQKPRAEWLALFAGRDVCCEPVLELDEVASHSLHVARKMFFTIDDPRLGPVAQMRTPVGEPSARRVAPRLGEDSEEVLVDYGFAPDEISALRDGKALG